MTEITEKQDKAFSDGIISEQTMRRINRELIAEVEWLKQKVKEVKSANTDLTIAFNEARVNMVESDELLLKSLKGQFLQYLQRDRLDSI